MQMAGTWTKIRIYKYSRQKSTNGSETMGPSCLGTLQREGVSQQQRAGRGEGVKTTGKPQSQVGPDTDPVSRGTWTRHSGEHTSSRNKGPPRKSKRRLREDTRHMGGE